jgi:hypothetical protein
MSRPLDPLCRQTYPDNLRRAGAGDAQFVPRHRGAAVARNAIAGRVGTRTISASISGSDASEPAKAQVVNLRFVAGVTMP